MSNSTLYLDVNGGEFFESDLINGEYGLLSTMKSLSVQKKSSKSSFNVACFNEKTGEFVLSDEHGTIYHVSLENNYYHLLRHSRSPISAMVFVQSRCDQLVISYENGIVVIIDILTNSIIGTLESSNSSTVKSMKSHIEKSMLATCTEDGTISLWDLRSMQCVRRIKLSEKVIDFNFEHDGELIVILLEISGAYIYRTSDFQLEFTCPIPLSERKPKWTSYCLYYHNLSKNTQAISNYSIIVSGDNGMIYIWNASRRVGYNTKDTVTATLSSLVELPVKMKMALSMAALGDSSCPLRLAIMSYEGEVIIVDIEEISQGLGEWIVVADIPSNFIQGKTSNVHRNNIKQNFISFVARNDLFIIIGSDGAARLFYSEESLGCGTLCGSSLRMRQPHSSKNRIVLNSSISTPIVSSKSSILNKKSLAKKKEERKNDIVIIKEPSDDKKNKNNIIKKSDMTDLALFEMVNLTPKDKRISERSLTAYLSIHGEFPDHHRPLIWRLLLKLPENSVAFSDLVRCDIHPSYKNLFERYPIAARRLFVRLQSVCSHLAHWSPIFGEVSYIPSIVFPFVLLFGADELAALESVMTILMWWGFSWQVTFPNPPINIVDSIDSLLKLHDVKLYSFFLRLDTSPGLLSWTILSTLFTEVLNKQDWFKLMDFIVLNFRQVSISLLTPIAILISLRTEIMELKSSTSVQQFLRNHQNIIIVKVIESIKNMINNTPREFFSAVATSIGKKNNTNNADSGLDEIRQMQSSMALSSDSPIFPLYKGRYPAYFGYPKFMVDWQLRGREKAMSIRNELERRDDVLHIIERKIEQIETESKQWFAKHEAATNSEVRHKRMMLEKEKSHMRELQQIEEEISKQRMISLGHMESSALDEIEVIQDVTNEARELMRYGEDHMREKIDLTFNLQKHRENSELCQASTHEKLRQIQIRRAKAEWLSTVEGGLIETTDELDTRDLFLAEKWKLKDEQKRIEKSIHLGKLKSNMETDNLINLQNEMNERIQRLHLARESKILEIERNRAHRLALEQSDDGLAANQRSINYLKEQETSITKKQQALLDEKNLVQSQENALESVEMIREESQRLLEVERQRLLKKGQLKNDLYEKEKWSSNIKNNLKNSVDDENTKQDQVLHLKTGIERAKRF